jgi:hypothetical protein
MTTCKCRHLYFYYFFGPIRKHSPRHRWALSLISVISNIGLSQISDSCYRTERAKSDIILDIGIKFYLISDIWHSLHYGDLSQLSGKVLAFSSKGSRLESSWYIRIFCKCRISEWTLMSISEHFRYRNDSFQSDIFVSDIGITDVNIRCRISPTLRSMSMPTSGSRIPDRRHFFVKTGQDIMFVQCVAIIHKLAPIPPNLPSSGLRRIRHMHFFMCVHRYTYFRSEYQLDSSTFSLCQSTNR